MAGAQIAVVVPARDEAGGIAQTVAALCALPGVAAVVVVDDGSVDDTGELARAAGADVVRHVRSRGKAAALETGAARLAVLEAQVTGRTTPTWLLLPAAADLRGSAANLRALGGPVADGPADMTTALSPPQERPGGGHGFVVRL